MTKRRPDSFLPSPPAWLKKRLIVNPNVDFTERVISELNLHTVCFSASCPNRTECFSRQTATFLILGNRCTRNCAFCGVAKGEPEPVNPDEPVLIAEATRRLGLRYLVITSVTRDDLPDGGAAAFAQTVTAVRRLSPENRVEVLTPDFQGQKEAVEVVTAAGPVVFNHNLETVPRLYSAVRPGASYRRSLAVLKAAKKAGASLTKSGLMVGLGETKEEILTVLKDLAAVGCDIVTIGQYLPPGRTCWPVSRYVTPEEFGLYQERARGLGLIAVCGPFVRSSYQAAAVVGEISLKANQEQ